MPIPEPLGKVLEAYCHVNATNIDMLSEHYSNPDWSYCKPEIFRAQLLSVIRERSILRNEYESLTCEDFDSDDELYEWLVEIWETATGEKLTV